MVLRGLVAGMTEVDGLASWREREAAELTRKDIRKDTPTNIKIKQRLCLRYKGGGLESENMVGISI